MSRMMFPCRDGNSLFLDPKTTIWYWLRKTSHRVVIALSFPSSFQCTVSFPTTDTYHQAQPLLPSLYFGQQRQTFICPLYQQHTTVCIPIHTITIYIHFMAIARVDTSDFHTLTCAHFLPSTNYYYCSSDKRTADKRERHQYFDDHGNL